MKFRSLIALAALGLATTSTAFAQRLSGAIKIDGSSTVFPITEAVAEEFMKRNPGVRVTVGISGTGGGFKKFANGEIDISDASRPIKKTEADPVRAKNDSYIELPVAYDALTVVVNPKNTWATSITTEELKKIWEPAAQRKIVYWDQVRKGWPHRPIKLYGPGADSGTFDYFTDAINGKEKASRGDFTASEDDNVLVQGVSRDVNALGYFGLAYYLENRNRLKAVPITYKGKTVAPSAAAVINGAYQPLSRPIFIYVRRSAANRPEVKAFVNFYLANAPRLVKAVGYVPLPNPIYRMAAARFRANRTGSIFNEGGSQVGVSLTQLMRAEAR